MSNPAPIRFARIVLILVWIFAAACFFFPLYYMNVGSFGRILFVVLAIAHAIEFPIFAGTYRQAGGSLLGHFLRHMVYGMVYRAEVMQGLKAT